MHDAQSSSSAPNKMDVAVHTGNLSCWDKEAGNCCKLESSQAYIASSRTLEGERRKQRKKGKSLFFNLAWQRTSVISALEKQMIEFKASLGCLRPFLKIKG